MNNYHKILLLI